MGADGRSSKAGVEGNVPGVMGWRGDLPKAGVKGNVPGSSKSWDGGGIFQLSPLSSLIPCKLILK